MRLALVAQPVHPRFSLNRTRKFRRLDPITAPFSVDRVSETLENTAVCAGGGGMADYPVR